jgi:hypothetical protein
MRVTPSGEDRASGNLVDGAANQHAANSDRSCGTHDRASNRRANAGSDGCADRTPHRRADRPADGSPTEYLRRTAEPMELQFLRGRHDQLTAEQLLQLLQVHPVGLAIDQGLRRRVSGRGLLALGWA